MSRAAPEEYRKLARVLERGDHARHASPLEAKAELDTATVEALRSLGYTD